VHGPGKSFRPRPTKSAEENLAPVKNECHTARNAKNEKR
jgi:hypothetical protein